MQRSAAHDGNFGAALGACVAEQGWSPEELVACLGERRRPPDAGPIPTAECIVKLVSGAIRDPAELPCSIGSGDVNALIADIAACLDQAVDPYRRLLIAFSTDELARFNVDYPFSW